MLTQFTQKLERRLELKKWLNLVLSPFSEFSATPIIVLGNQKSGTTAIAALLAEYADMSVTLDLPDIYYPLQNWYQGHYGFENFVNHYRFCFSRQIIKEPHFTFLYPQLKDCFPQAQFVFIVRDPRDNIRSILNRTNVQGDLPEWNPDSSPLRSPVWREILTGKWLTLSGSYIEILAKRWNVAVDVCLNNTNGMTLVRYEDFLQNKVGSINELAKRLGLSARKDIAKKVDKQYQSKGSNRGTSWLDFFGEHNLTRIEQICASRMQQFDYHPSQECMAGMESNG